MLKTIYDFALLYKRTKDYALLLLLLLPLLLGLCVSLLSLLPDFSVFFFWIFFALFCRNRELKKIRAFAICPKSNCNSETLILDCCSFLFSGKGGQFFIFFTVEKEMVGQGTPRNGCNNNSRQYSSMVLSFFRLALAKHTAYWFCFFQKFQAKKKQPLPHLITLSW